MTAAQVTLPQRADIATALAWTQYRLVFNASPLTDVANEFNRYSARRLIVADPDLENFRISGVFSSTDPTLLLRFLQAQPDIEVEETGSAIRISQR